MGINPGNPAFALPPAEDSLVRQVKDLERTMRENLASVVDSFKTTVARLDDAISRLDTAIASVTLPASNQDGVNNYTISTTSTVRKSVTFTVPDGYTRALVLATAEAMGYNGSGAGDYLYVQANVAGVDGGELLSFASAGVGVGLSALLYWELNDLSSGETFDVSVKTRTSANPWPASTSNQANIYALVIYMR